MNQRYYVPILKWKTGEKRAVKQLSVKHKSCIKPLVEVVDLFSSTDLARDLKECFGSPMYIDTINVDAGDRKFIIDLSKKSIESGIKIYPVLYYDDVPGTTNQLVDCVDKVLFRVPVPEDIDGPSYSVIFGQIAQWAKDSKINVDIMLDVEFVEGGRNASARLSDLKNTIHNYLLSEVFYEKLIIASTSFPETLSSMAAGDVRHVDRYDIKIYTKLLEDQSLAHVSSRLLYSDYGVTKYTDTEIDFSKMKYPVLPKVRYTTENAYWILKGKRNHLSKEWVKGYIELAKEVCKSEYFYGKNFSFGDLEIYKKAYELEGIGPGNNTNWVTISANHHIAVVTEQLSMISDF